MTVKIIAPAIGIWIPSVLQPSSSRRRVRTIIFSDPIIDTDTAECSAVKFDGKEGTDMKSVHV